MNKPLSAEEAEAETRQQFAVRANSILAFIECDDGLRPKLREAIVEAISSMAGVLGLEVLARMRADDRTKELPCVILTAAGHDTQRERAMTLGATDFMTKPFSPKRLLHRTAELAGVNVGPDPRD